MTGEEQVGSVAEGCAVVLFAPALVVWWAAMRVVEFVSPKTRERVKSRLDNISKRYAPSGAETKP